MEYGLEILSLILICKKIGNFNVDGELDDQRKVYYLCGRNKKIY